MSRSFRLHWTAMSLALLALVIVAGLKWTEPGEGPLPLWRRLLEWGSIAAITMAFCYAVFLMVREPVTEGWLSRASVKKSSLVLLAGWALWGLSWLLLNIIPGETRVTFDGSTITIHNIFVETAVSCVAWSGLALILWGMAACTALVIRRWRPMTRCGVGN